MSKKKVRPVPQHKRSTETHPLVCTLCPKRFKNPEALHTHLEAIHASVANERGPNT